MPVRTATSGGNSWHIFPRGPLENVDIGSAAIRNRYPRCISVYTRSSRRRLVPMPRPQKKVKRGCSSVASSSIRFWWGRRFAFVRGQCQHPLTEVRQARLRHAQFSACRKYPSSTFFTSRGFMGRGPIHAKPGDRVCILYGSKVPFLLRQTEDGDAFHLLGECCKCSPKQQTQAELTLRCFGDVEGVMHGETMGKSHERAVVHKNFLLQ